MPRAGADLFSGLGVPESDGVVVRAAGEFGPIGAEGDAPDRALVARAGADLLSGLGVPESDHAVVVPGGDQRAVRTDRHGLARRGGRRKIGEEGGGGGKGRAKQAVGAKCLDKIRIAVAPISRARRNRAC